MRISVINGDRGYRAWRGLPANVVAFVKIDGADIRDCCVADTKTGYVLALERDEHGLYLLNAKGTAVKRRQLRGRVEIEIRART
jgi:hypothetical protein